MLGKILGGIGLVLLVLIILGFVLPDKVHLEREIVIDAPQDEVYALVSDLGEMEKWSPWAKIDPDMTSTIAGEGVGQTMSWQSDHPNVGDGAQMITALDPPSQVKVDLDFGDKGLAKAALDLSPAAGGGTKVVWSFDTNMRDGVPFYMKPMSTYFGFMMDGMLGPQYEEGLSSLKELAEAGGG
ncbi:MAG: SRPBCC family protein [Marinicaulis sp.]|nr:SRPBCC family protein [Marinicaulis sp.]